MSTVKELMVKFSADISNFSKNLKQVQKDTKKGMNNVEKEMDGIGKGALGAGNQFAKMGGKIKTAIKGVVTVAAVRQVAMLGKQAIETAAEYKALDSQFQQVFGKMEKDASKSLSSISKETGINSNRLKGSFVKIAAFAKTTGMSTKGSLDLTSRATQAAADSAAFYDRSIEEVTENLQSFLKGK